MKVYKKLMNALAAVEKIVLVISTLLILVLTVGNVFSRKVIHRSWSFTEELVVAVFVLITLQELIQADQRRTVTYELLETSGPSNAPEFKVAVMMDDMCLGIGKGTSKKKAEQQAAKDALNKMATK